MKMPWKQEKKMDNPIDKYNKWMTFKQRVTQYVYNYEPKNNQNLPTIRDVAKKFRMKQANVLYLIEDIDELEYNVGFAVGSGHYEYPMIGDYTVEYYE